MSVYWHGQEALHIWLCPGSCHEGSWWRVVMEANFTPAGHILSEETTSTSHAEICFPFCCCATNILCVVSQQWMVVFTIFTQPWTQSMIHSFAGKTEKLCCAGYYYVCTTQQCLYLGSCSPHVINAPLFQLLVAADQVNHIHRTQHNHFELQPHVPRVSSRHEQP